MPPQDGTCLMTLAFYNAFTNRYSNKSHSLQQKWSAMKKTAILLLICLLASCTPQAHSTGTAAPAPTFTPTITSTTTATVTPTAAFTTAMPFETAEFYRIRVEFVTTSDWTTLSVVDTENILTMITTDFRGNATQREAGIEKLVLTQSLAEAEAGKIVSLDVDYALAPESIDVPFQIHVEKGDLGNSTVSVYAVIDNQQQLIQDFKHPGRVQNSAGRNPKDFSVDLMSLQNTAPTSDVVPLSEKPRMVWAFYYPWYSTLDWSRPVLKDHPLTLYDSSERATIERQVGEAKSAGIDGFISSWWGPETETDRNLRTLLDVAQEKDFKVSIYFETLSGPGETPLDETHIHDELAYVIREYGDHSAFMQVDGKPLIVLWASGTVSPGTWLKVIPALKQEGLDAVYLGMGYNVSNLDMFEGLHRYSIFDDPDLQQTYQAVARTVRYYPLLSYDRSLRIWAATVQPGHDDQLLPGREGKVQDRLNGASYRSTWEAAIQSNPDWIFITTWNEWWEHTYIEPSELYGDQYLKITREYADKWKNK